MQTAVALSYVVLCGIASLLFGLQPTHATTPSPTISSSTPSLTTTTLSSIQQKINRIMIQPCGNSHTSLHTAVDMNMTSNVLVKMLRVTKRLKRHLKVLDKKYRVVHADICEHPGRMEVAHRNLISYCDLPTPLGSTNATDLMRHISLTTKWLFWMTKAEYRLSNSTVLQIARDAAPIRFESVANYSKETFCALTSHGLPVSAETHDEIISCRLPPLLGINDPEALIPESCLVLDQLKNFANKIHVQLCSLYSHLKPCSIRKRATKPDGKKKRRNNRRRKNKGKKQQKRRKNRQNRKRKGTKGKGKKNNRKNRKNNKRNRRTTSSPVTV